MYCRDCHYDLRGQENVRCPECGAGFDPGDSSTFYNVFPTRRVRARIWLTSRRWLLATLLTLGLALYAPEATYHIPSWQRADALQAVVWSNLRNILTEWAIQRNDHPDRQTFDTDAARQNHQGSFSVKEQPKRRGYQKCVKLLNSAPWFGIPLAMYMALMLWVFARHSRGRILVLLALAVLLPILASNRFAIAGFFWPKSHQYLDDYVLLDKSRWIQDPPYVWPIVAYEKPGGRPNLCIGYEAGFIRCPPVEELEDALAVLGVDLIQSPTEKHDP